MKDIPAFNPAERRAVEAAMIYRYGQLVDLQEADVEVRLTPGSEALTTVPGIYWNERKVQFVVCKLGDRRYRSYFFYTEEQQYRIGEQDYDVIEDCVRNLLQLQVDHDVKRRAIMSNPGLGPDESHLVGEESTAPELLARWKRALILVAGPLTNLVGAVGFLALAFMIGAEVPGVFINVMRGGPGLGNIAPEQADIKLCCRGLGHGNTHAIVLAPSTPQEMLDLTMLAFELSFKYRNPVVIASDGYLGQMTGKVSMPAAMVKPGIPQWAVWGDRDHRRNLISSIYLSEADLESWNVHLNEKYEAMKVEQRADLYMCDDAEVVLVACTTPSRMAKGAVQALRAQGIKAGLFRPITLWPFPIEKFGTVHPNAKRIVVVEASNGQLEDELKLALANAGVRDYPQIEHVRHFGGVLPQLEEIVVKVAAGQEVTA